MRLKADRRDAELTEWRWERGWDAKERVVEKKFEGGDDGAS